MTDKVTKDDIAFLKDRTELAQVRWSEDVTAFEAINHRDLEFKAEFKVALKRLKILEDLMNLIARKSRAEPLDHGAYEYDNLDLLVGRIVQLETKAKEQEELAAEFLQCFARIASTTDILVKNQETITDMIGFEVAADV